jgi:hypothetical protein
MTHCGLASAVDCRIFFNDLQLLYLLTIEMHTSDDWQRLLIIYWFGQVWV